MKNDGGILNKRYLYTSLSNLIDLSTKVSFFYNIFYPRFNMAYVRAIQDHRTLRSISSVKELKEYQELIAL